MHTPCSIDSKLKISKFDSTSCQILRPKCTKFDFRWGSAPDPAGERTALFLTGLLLKREGKREGRGGKGREGEWGRDGRRVEEMCRTNVKILPTRLFRQLIRRQTASHIVRNKLPSIGNRRQTDRVAIFVNSNTYR